MQGGEGWAKDAVLYSHHNIRLHILYNAFIQNTSNAHPLLYRSVHYDYV
jgi:hypothetical protein